MRLIPVMQMHVLEIMQSVVKAYSASSTKNWCSTLKESVLGFGSYFPPLQSVCGALVSDQEQVV